MRNRILSTLAILFGLMMINSGLNKFFNYMPIPEVSPEMMKILMAFLTLKWVFPLVGIVETAGGILMIIPRFRALGAIVILPITTGILIHHIVHDISGIAIGLILFLINVWVIIESKQRYLHLIEAGL